MIRCSRTVGHQVFWVFFKDLQIFLFCCIILYILDVSFNCSGSFIYILDVSFNCSGSFIYIYIYFLDVSFNCSGSLKFTLNIVSIIYDMFTQTHFLYCKNGDYIVNVDLKIPV